MLRAIHLRLDSALLALVAVTAMALCGQTPTNVRHIEFEVASVKPNPNPGGEAYVQVLPGRLRIQNIPVRNLIQLAYGVEGYQIAGGPSWIAFDRFDIEATAKGSPTTQQMQGPMLETLLKDRFKLMVHRETRESPVYEIKLLKGSGKLQPSTAGNCVHYNPDAPPPALSEPGQQRPNFCDYPHLGRDGRSRTLDGKGISIADVVITLARVELRRTVIDRTDLAGTFDIHLKWTPDSAADVPEAADAPSIFTAVREQLGLRLDAGRAPLEVIVVDRIEKPSAN